MFKVVKAEYETGCYRVFSSLTNNLYDIICYDGIYNPLDETTVASPVSFTVRGCVNKDAAIQKIKRYLKHYEKSIITIKNKRKGVNYHG